MVTVLNQNQRYVVVVNFLYGYNGSQPTIKDYDFWCDMQVQQNDVVIVDTSRGIQLARVVGVKKTSKAADKWVVQKVDLSTYEARIKAEEKRKELEKAMQERLEKSNKLMQYQALATTDPVMAKLLEEYHKVEESQVFIWEDAPKQVEGGDQ